MLRHDVRPEALFVPRFCALDLRSGAPPTGVRLALPARRRGTFWLCCLEGGMAEIKVEAKRSGLGWLWALIILALLALGLWYLMSVSHAVPATATPADSVRTSLFVPIAAFAEGQTNG